LDDVQRLLVTDERVHEVIRQQVGDSVLGVAPDLGDD
jgi:hypothetical protein